MVASTQYWVTSAFYLHWISPDQIIYEGEEAYVGCEAVGLEGVAYEWQVSRDGGEAFEDDAKSDKSGGKSIPQLGDEQMMGFMCRCLRQSSSPPGPHAPQAQRGGGRRVGLSEILPNWRKGRSLE